MRSQCKYWYSQVPLRLARAVEPAHLRARRALSVKLEGSGEDEPQCKGQPGFSASLVERRDRYRMSEREMAGGCSMLLLLPRSYRKGLEMTMRLSGAGFEVT